MTKSLKGLLLFAIGLATIFGLGFRVGLLFEKRNQSMIDANLSLAYAVAGQGCSEKGNTTEALIWFGRASGANPNNYAYAMRLAEITEAQGSNSTALLESKHALGLLLQYGSGFSSDEDKREIARITQFIERLSANDDGAELPKGTR